MDTLIINKAPTIEIEKPNDINEVTLSGTIVNKYETDKVIIITLGINDSHKGKVFSYYPSIYFYKEDETGAEIFLLHEKVDILAAAVSAKKVRDNGSEYKRQGLCGINIKPLGELYPPHKPYYSRTERKRYNININKAVIEGVIRSITQVKDGIYDISVQTMRAGKVNFVHFVYFSKEYPTIQAGMKVHIEASITTKTKEFEVHTKTFQSFVIHTINVLEDNSADKAVNQ